MRCRRPGSSTGGRFLARRAIATASASRVIWSGSNCTVTVPWPATARRTSRRLCRAAARAMARVLSAVSRRVPSSARSAVSPSGWTRTRTPERCGGMCAHKDGVEDSGHDSDAQQSRACDADRPRRDDCGHDHVPGREVPAHAADRGGDVEQVAEPAGGREPRDGVWEKEQHEQSPDEKQWDEYQRAADKIAEARSDRRRQRRVRDHERSRGERQQKRYPGAVVEQTRGPPPPWRPIRAIQLRRAHGEDGVSEQGDEKQGKQRHGDKSHRPRAAGSRPERPRERVGDPLHAGIMAAPRGFSTPATLVSRDYRAFSAPSTLVSRDYPAFSAPATLVSRDYRAFSAP